MEDAQTLFVAGRDYNFRHGHHKLRVVDGAPGICFVVLFGWNEIDVTVQ